MISNITVDKSTKEDLGRHIKLARENRGLTQADVAKKSKMTVTYYAMIERGEVNPSLEKIKSIAKVLKLKIVIS